MYHVIGTGVSVAVFYLISFLLVKIGYFSLQIHRKFWNSILASVFIIAATAGLFLALQVNYKWNIPFVKTILKWHVEFGIGLAVTGIFHFVWHLSYFGNILKNPEKTVTTASLRKIEPAGFIANLFMIGFISTSVQLLLIREVMNIAGGYELITGVFLCSWLVGSAIGASLAGNSSLNDIKTINAVFSFGPVISVLFLLLFSRLILNTGETPSFLTSIFYTFIVLLPFCMISGFTFVKLISFGSVNANFVPGKSFAVETTGGIAAGLIISILTAGILNNYQLILSMIILSNAYTYISWYIKDQKIKISVSAFSVILLISVVLFRPDNLFRQVLMPGITVTGTEDTPYGNITTGKYNGEESRYYDHRLISYKEDVAEREENIHYAMLQCESPEKVLVISGSFKSNLPEILKYPVKEITCIERDPELAKKENFSPGSLTSVHSVVNEDAFRYMKLNSGKKDVIILLVPPPSTLLLNRYYTDEFFQLARKRLDNGGVFMCSPGLYDTYLNNESLKLYSSVYNSLAGVFKNVLPIAGNKLYFIASDKELSTSVCYLSDLRNIKNTYVSSDFLADDLIASKSKEVISLMDLNIRTNSLAFPVASFYFQSYNFTRFLNEKTPALILLILLFAVPFFAVKRGNLIMYCSASALAGFEIIVLISLQLIVGNMYQLTGLIIAGLMAGLALGAGANFSFLNSSGLKLKGMLLILFYILFGLIADHLLEIQSMFIASAILVFSAFLPSLITGNIFRELTLKSEGLKASSSVYSADLAGTAFGLILISGWIIPAFGIKISVIILSVFIFTGLLFGTNKNK